jgi:Rrp15p
MVSHKKSGMGSQPPPTNSHLERSASSNNNGQHKKRSRHGKHPIGRSKSNNMVVEEELLDRFAGSSEEEMDEQENEEMDEIIDNENRDQTSGLPKRDDNNDDKGDSGDSGESDNENNEVVNDNICANMHESNKDDLIDHGIDDDDDNEPRIQLTSGLANAMSRILSSSISTLAKSSSKVSTITSSNVVLSKTKTPLQIQAAKERAAQDALKETRRLNRERKLNALRIPLTVATTMTMSNGGNSTGLNSIAVELEAERVHRRVATRGIVALFNAIAQHQVRPDQTAAAAAAAGTALSTADGSKSSTATSGNKLTKHGFLDLIKQKATNTANSGSTTIVSSEDTGNNRKKWNALKDDYMLDSSKNWDEVDDSDDGSNEAENPKKKIRHNRK